LTDSWATEFLPGLEPPWLDAFRSDPVEALNRLLRGSFYRDEENLLEPSEALYRWAVDLSGRPDFQQALDAALASWFGAEASGDMLSYRRAWAQASDVLTELTELSTASKALRTRYLDRQTFLEALAIDGASDLVDRTLMALAHGQTDRMLEAQWRQLVELVGTTPIVRGRIGLLGFAGLPPADGEERGGFRPDLVDPLLTFAHALARRVDAEVLSERRAREVCSEATELLLVRYPFRPAWSRAIGARLDVRIAPWFDEFVKEDDRLADASLDSGKPVRPSDVSWGEIADRARELRKEALACRGNDAERALALSATALEIEPWDAYSWTARMLVLNDVRGPAAALPVAWAALDRFPHNEVCWHQLGLFLRALGRHSVAEEVWTEGLERFPDSGPLANSIGALLLDIGRAIDAADVLEPYVTRYPENRQAMVTLGDVYRLLGLHERAEEVFRPAVEADSDNPYDWSGLIRVLRDAGRTGEAKQWQARARARFPGVPYFKKSILSGPPAPPPPDDVSGATPRERALLRRGLRRRGAAGQDVAYEREQLLDQARNHGPPLQGAVEAGFLLTDLGAPANAIRLLEETRSTLGDSLELLYASGRARRREAEQGNFTRAAFRERMEPIATLRTRADFGRPLLALTAVRLSFAMNHHPDVRQQRDRSIEHLREELRAPTRGGRPDDQFHPWWRQQVQRRLDETGHLESTEHMNAGIVEDRILDDLEEDYVRHLSAGMVV
jgi:tetratricopeptide (TPR) repeat protein